jgi:predicted PurR-regulated permease PerM
MNKGVFFALLYFTGLLCVVALMMLLLYPFLSSMAWAGFIALATFPLHRRLMKLARGRENVGSALTTGVVVLLIVIPMAILFVAFAGQATHVFVALQKFAAAGHIPGRVELLNHPAVVQLTERFPVLKEIELQPMLVSAMKVVSGIAVGASKAVVINLFTGIFKFFIMVAVLFFAYRDGEKIASAFWDIVPLKETDKQVLQGAVKRVVNAVMYGIVLTCVVQGILGGVGFAIVGLPSPVFFGVVMIITAFIPVVGTALVWVPGALYLLATGQPVKALILTLWCIAVVSSIDNFIRPYFISTRSKIPLLVILLGVLGGLASMGFLGIIVGPLLFTVSLELFRVYREDISPTLRKRIAEDAETTGLP